ncbi:MAG TPA: alpha/beta hydrolase-fold protein [Aquaticitalea sp.]|nr:alpha/beta hydrolase-fold protein [Aquaticitalea sp.]
MKKYLTLSLMLFITLQLSAQVIYESFQSNKLAGKRDIKIQLPRNYDPQESVEYPLIIVLDGDYLFEPVIGNVDYQSYWDEMPKCVVVGINQSTSRDKDLHYDDELYFPSQDGAAFFEFIGMELIPYIENKYKVSKFRIAIGHDMSANFLNYYLFKEYPIFRAFVMFSPDQAPEMGNRLRERLARLQTESFYYLATADGDIEALQKEILNTDALLKTIENPKLHYRFDNFEDADHYSLVGLAIPKAFNQIFELYKPINVKEYKEKLLTFEGTPFEYLLKKYKNIQDFYGFKKKVVENDLKAIASAANKKDDLETLKELSKLARKEYPESMISAYYQGLYHEKDNNLKKALQYYNSGLLLEPSDFIDKEILLDKIYAIQDKE